MVGQLTEDWLTDFFSAPNLLTIREIESTLTVSPLQVCHLNSLAKARGGQFPYLLPMLERSPIGGEVLSFYLCGKNSRHINEFRAVIGRHVNESFCHATFNDDDSVNSKHYALLESKFGGNFVKFSIPEDLSVTNPDRQLWIYQQLLKATTRFSLKPSVSLRRPKTIGQLLSSFFSANKAQDARLCREIFEQILRTQNLNAYNVFHLQLQTLEVEEDWDSVLEKIMSSPSNFYILTEITFVIALRAISEKIFSGGFYLDDYEVEDLKISLNPMEPLFLNFPKFDVTVENQSIWRTWAIGLKIFGSDKHPSVQFGEKVGIPWFRELERWGSVKNDSLVSNSQVIPSRESDDVEQLKILLISRAGKSDTELAGLKSEVMNFSDVVLEKVRSGIFKDALNELVESDFTEIVIDNWCDLFTQASRDNISYGQQICLEEKYTKWSLLAWNEEELCALLETLDETEYEKVRVYFSALIEWVDQFEIPISASFLIFVMEHMCLDDLSSHTDLLLFTKIVKKLVVSTHSIEDYRKALECISYLWGDIESIYTVNESFSTIEDLLDVSCKDKSARLNLWMNFCGSYQQFWGKLDSVQRHTIRQLDFEFPGSVNVFPADIDVDEIETLVSVVGKKLAIATLTEGAGRRAKKSIEKLYPGLEIYLNHDKTNTDALSNLAKKCDYFIFSSKSAAHQAFFAVKNVRQEAINYPEGKGSSSIVRAFVDIQEKKNKGS